MHFCCDIFEGLPDFDTVPKLGGGAFGTGNKEEDLKFFRSVHLEPVRSDGAARLLAPARVLSTHAGCLCGAGQGRP
jgi:hypothetical protein